MCPGRQVDRPAGTQARQKIKGKTDGTGQGKEGVTALAEVRVGQVLFGHVCRLETGGMRVGWQAKESRQASR